MKHFIRHGFMHFRTIHNGMELQGEALPLHRLSVTCQNMRTEPDFIYCSVIGRNVNVVLTTTFYSTSFLHQFVVSAWLSGIFSNTAVIIFGFLELPSLPICPTGNRSFNEDSY